MAIIQIDKSIDITKLKRELEQSGEFKVLSITPKTSSTQAVVDIALASGSENFTSGQTLTITSIITAHIDRLRKRILVQDAPDGNDTSDAAVNKKFIKEEIATLLNQAPEYLDTIKEIADAIGGNQQDYPLTDSILKQLTDLRTTTSGIASTVSAETTRATAAEAAITTSLSQEVVRATSAEQTLSSSISLEATTRASADTTLQGNLNAEITARQNADTSLSQRIATLENAPAAVVTLDGLSDVTLTTPTSNQVLKYNGTGWINSSLPTETLSLDNLSDVQLSSSTEGQLLGFDGTKWNNTNTLIATSTTTPALIVKGLSGLTSPILSIKTNTNSDIFNVYQGATNQIQVSGTTKLFCYGEVAASKGISIIIPEADLSTYVPLTFIKSTAGGQVPLFTVDSAGAITSPTITTIQTRLTNLEASTLTLDSLADVVLTSVATNNILRYNGTSWVNQSFPTTVVTTLNGSTSSTQTFASGTTGTDFAISTSGSVHTFNLPDASSTARGVVTTSAQTIAGVKTFSSAPKLSSLTADRPLRLTATNDIIAQKVDLSSASDVQGTLPISLGGTGGTTAQTAINNISSVSSATNGQVLTRNSSGNAVWANVSATSALLDGTAGSPSLYFTNNTNMGVYRKANNVMGFVANGQPAIMVDGNSGVGRLAVGDIATTLSRLQLVDDNNNAASGITLGASASTCVQLYKSASNTLRIDGLTINTGYLAYGGLTISSLTRASTLTTSDAGIALGSTNGNAPFIAATKLNGGAGTATSLYFKTSDTDRMIITSDGNVGIGVASPATKLHVGGTIYSTDGLVATGSITSEVSSEVGGSIRIQNNTKTGSECYFWMFYNMKGGGSYSNALQLWRYPASGGAIQTTIWDDGGTLTHNAGISAQGTVWARDNVQVGGDINITGMVTDLSGTDVGLTGASSGVGANWLCKLSSSLRYKTDVETILPEYSDKILNFRPVWYRANTETTISRSDWSWFGLIAEEVAEIEPRLVNFEYAPEDLDPETHLPKEGAQLRPESVAYSKLSVLLIDVVKRQRDKIQSLEERLAKLESLIASKE